MPAPMTAPKAIGASESRAWKPRPTASARTPYVVKAGVSTVGPSVPSRVSSNTTANTSGPITSAHRDRISSPPTPPTNRLMTIDQIAWLAVSGLRGVHQPAMTAHDGSSADRDEGADPPGPPQRLQEAGPSVAAAVKTGAPGSRLGSGASHQRHRHEAMPPRRARHPRGWSWGDALSFARSGRAG